MSGTLLLPLRCSPSAVSHCPYSLRGQRCAVDAALFAVSGAPMQLRSSRSAVRRCSCALRGQRCAVAAALFAVRGAPVAAALCIRIIHNSSTCYFYFFLSKVARKGEKNYAVCHHRNKKKDAIAAAHFAARGAPLPLRSSPYAVLGWHLKL